MSKKKLLIATSTYPLRENDNVSARFIYDLSLAMKEYYDVFVVAPHHYDAEITGSHRGINVIRYKYFFPVSIQLLSSGKGIASDLKGNLFAYLQLPFFLLAQLFCVIRTVLREKCEVVNSHWIVPQGIMAALSKKVLKINHVATVHAAGIFLLKRSGAMGRVLARFVVNNSDAVFPVSKYISEQVIALAADTGEKISIIPMGVDTEKFYADSGDKKTTVPSKFTFLFVGKFIEKKGIYVLLKAVELLKDRFSEFHVILAGGGILTVDIEKAIEEKGIKEIVTLKGWVHNDRLAELYRICDVVVVPSVFDSKRETEGMPVVINEAFASGMPVIASDISGIPDMVIDGHNGWLFTPGDHLRLAEIMGEAIDSPEIKDLSAKALETSKQYSWENIAAKYDSEIRRICQ